MSSKLILWIFFWLGRLFFVRQKKSWNLTRAQSKSIKALDNKLYFHEPRQAIERKNKFKSQQVDIKFIRNKIKRSIDENHRSFPDREDKNRILHEIKIDGWYLKFFLKIKTSFL